MPVDYKKEIKQELSKIEKLIETPNFIKDVVVESLQSFNTDDCLTNIGKNKFSNLIKTISNIDRKNLENSYKIIYNQLCILAVSSLNALLEKYFINYVNSNLDKIEFKNDFKVTSRELKEYNFNLKSDIGRLILRKDNSVNFQDLKSTVRSFNDYIGKEIFLEENLQSTIVFYQQCRHVLVHKNGEVDNEFLKKIEGCNIKKYKEKDIVQLGEEDWDNIKKSFKELIKELTS